MFNAANWVFFIIGKMIGAVAVSAMIRYREKRGEIDPAAALAAVDTIATAGDDLRVVPFQHASFVLLWHGLTIWIDPVRPLDPDHGLPAPK